MRNASAICLRARAIQAVIRASATAAWQRIARIVPRSAGLQRPSRLAALGVAQIGGNDTEFVREFVEWVEQMRLQARDGRVEPAAGITSSGNPDPAAS